MQKLYKVRQVALLYGVNEETVRRWIRTGKLQIIDCHNSGRKLGFDIDEESLISFETKYPKYRRISYDRSDNVVRRLEDYNYRLEYDQLTRKYEDELRKLKLKYHKI